MSGSRLYKDYLMDMLDAIEKAESFLGNLLFEEFIQNDEKVYAVIRALEILGEAAKQIPEPIRMIQPDIP